MSDALDRPQHGLAKYTRGYRPGYIHTKEHYQCSIYNQILEAIQSKHYTNYIIMKLTTLRHFSPCNAAARGIVLNHSSEVLMGVCSACVREWKHRKLEQVGAFRVPEPGTNHSVPCRCRMVPIKTKSVHNSRNESKNYARERLLALIDLHHIVTSWLESAAVLLQCSAVSGLK